MPSGLESVIALVVSKRAARVGSCNKPKAYSSNPKAPQTARMTIIQVISVAPMAFGASHTARSAPARQTRRIASATGLTVRSILSTGGGGGDFIRGSDPQGQCRRQDEGERAESRLSVLPWVARPVLAAARSTWAKVR